ncbi:hypothetical protein 1 [Sanxia tombus-like virus 1]|uniref:hypothetical protein 1 n=1 Tax=Sanxia tombus-like virus 1 TaxID=1923385 RepID=UPI00090C0F7C|nr:hypothetical protein 1 [Sanxia tombus-like virus 1]APG76446.1 hypothetical protein 1 [Sanxia tombus-like virus 1]
MDMWRILRRLCFVRRNRCILQMATKWLGNLNLLCSRISIVDVISLGRKYLTYGVLVQGKVGQPQLVTFLSTRLFIRPFQTNIVLHTCRKLLLSSRLGLQCYPKGFNLKFVAQNPEHATVFGKLLEQLPSSNWFLNNILARFKLGINNPVLAICSKVSPSIGLSGPEKVIIKMAKTKNKNMTQKVGATAMGYSNSYKTPKMQTVGSSIIVKHKELIRQVASQSAFNVAEARINPADLESFPWLAGIATRYEKYRFLKMKFTLVPQVPTTAPGSLGLYFDYDATDLPAPNATQFFSNLNAVTTQIWMEASTVVLPQPMELYCATKYDGQNPKWFDYGRIKYFMQSSVQCLGYLFVEYEVELSKPAQTVGQISRFSGHAYWQTLSQSADVPVGTPTWIEAVTVDGAPGQISVPYSGWYRVQAICNSTVNTATLIEICGSAIAALPLGLDANTNPKTYAYTAIVFLTANVPFYAFKVSAGFVDVTADPNGADSPLGIELELVGPV